MADVTAHHYGSTAWLARISPDGAAVREFYRLILDWRFHHHTVPGGADRVTARVKGSDVAEFVDGYGDASWIVYFASDDVTRTCADVTSYGGMAGPVMVGDQGRYAIGCDPEGRRFGIWQASSTRTAFGRTHVPGALSWLGTTSADTSGIQAFYRTIFGQTYTDKHEENGTPYFLVRSGNAPSAGIGAAIAGAEGWLPYFAVDDADWTAEWAVDLDGDIIEPIRDVPGHGKIVRLADPTGCEFAIVERCSVNA